MKHGEIAHCTAGLGRSEVFGYAVGSIGTGVFSTVPTVLLLYFCTDVLILAPALAATVVLLPKIWAIAWDPFVGNWSDRTTSRMGRRRPFLLAGLLGVAVAFVAVFTPPGVSGAALFTWMALSYFALTTCYSLFAVPYVAIPAEVGENARERRRLVAARMVVAMIGVLLGAGVAPMLVETAGGGRSGYGFMSLVIAGVCVLFMAGPLLMLRGRDGTIVHRPNCQASLPQQLMFALRHRPFRWLLATYVLQLTAASILSSTAPYLITGAFSRAEGDIGTAMGLMLSATALAVPGWSWVGRSWREDRALAVAAGFFAVAAVTLGLAVHMSVPWPFALGLFVFAGVPFAGLQVLPYTLVAHLIHDANGDRHGSGNEGVYTGVWTAAEKLGLALGPAATGVALMFWADSEKGLAAFAMGASALFAIASLPLLALMRSQGTPALRDVP